MCQKCVAVNSRIDPTNTAGIRRRAFAEIRKRLRGLYADLRPIIFDDVQKVETVPDTNSLLVNRNRYYYDFIAGVDMDREIQRLLNKWFDTGATEPPPRWFFSQEVDAAYARGTETGASRLRQISGETASLFDIEQILRSRAYIDRIARVRMRAFENMQGLTTDMKSDLRRVLSDGVARGQSPTAIARNIRERLNVQQSIANKIARTEIGTAFRDSRRELAVDSRDRLGLDIRLQWVSALASTTRPSHAERHLNYYTPEEVADFYSQDGNSINCLCSQNEVIITPTGEILGQRHWTDRDRKEVDRILDAA